jgi:DNA-directed RNA polymerase subunit L
MEFKVLEESKNKIVFELVGETHTFCNALKKELQDNKDVKLASYRIDHPLVGVPRFILETTSEPRKVLKAALNSLKKKAEEFKKEVKKL